MFTVSFSYKIFSCEQFGTVEAKKWVAQDDVLNGNEVEVIAVDEHNVGEVKSAISFGQQVGKSLRCYKH